MNKLFSICIIAVIAAMGVVNAQTDSVKYDWAVYPSKANTGKTNNSTDTLQFVNIKNGAQGQSTIHKPQDAESISSELKQKTEPKTKGYRLQVFLSQDKEQVMKMKAEFIKNFDDVEVYVDRKAPNYRLKVGDFYNRFDANAYKLKIAKLYPNAIVVSDDVSLPKVIIEEVPQNSNE
jgi:hypothetical protein